MMVWLPEEERYLQRLRASCDTLARYFLARFKRYRSIQGKFRLPAIILSSLSGVASFGTTTFPRNVQRWVGVVVGGVNIVIAVLNTVEAYMKTADMLAKAMTAYTAFKKLGDDIQCELTLPAEDRQTTGLTFVRDCYTRYQQIIDQAPPIEEPRLLFIADGAAAPARLTKRLSQAVSQMFRQTTGTRSSPMVETLDRSPQLQLTVGRERQPKEEVAPHSV